MLSTPKFGLAEAWNIFYIISDFKFLESKLNILTATSDG